MTAKRMVIIASNNSISRDSECADCIINGIVTEPKLMSIVIWMMRVVLVLLTVTTVAVRVDGLLATWMVL